LRSSLSLLLSGERTTTTPARIPSCSRSVGVPSGQRSSSAPSLGGTPT
jgi:hypothetical protein